MSRLRAVVRVWRVLRSWSVLRVFLVPQLWVVSLSVRWTRFACLPVWLALLVRCASYSTRHSAFVAQENLLLPHQHNSHTEKKKERKERKEKRKRKKERKKKNPSCVPTDTADLKGSLPMVGRPELKSRLAQAMPSAAILGHCIHVKRPQHRQHPGGVGNAKRQGADDSFFSSRRMPPSTPEVETPSLWSMAKKTASTVGEPLQGP